MPAPNVLMDAREGSRRGKRRRAPRVKLKLWLRQLMHIIIEGLALLRRISETLDVARDSSWCRFGLVSFRVFLVFESDKSLISLIHGCLKRGCLKLRCDS